MNQRIQFAIQNGKQVLVVDLSNCSALEVVKLAREVPKVVTAQPRDSVLLLADLSGASFDREAVRAMKEAAVFDKPYIKRAAWVGAENLPHVFYENLKSFARREFPVFNNREAALKWLTED
ncbi:MAG: STAS/SEC14 domain-containing protein [Acidobacteria bacterium]|nr:STAS/SEC14 domain-containing protein [Acidobacteriota bacterium]